ncbi:hypothetical protein FE257_007099 [Aspergillus nanangensis]|uniref:F-box domain-containing protein n=1 Tax=Aspergillus nanangensis TaxID=2582783 RepID=A0AAD4CN85_ASPNN|nr:hypothetical protein FE257_007099 [Aspergillus nanangensis]
MEEVSSQFKWSLPICIPSSADSAVPVPVVEPKAVSWPAKPTSTSTRAPPQPMHSVYCNAPLENLPPEIRLLLLSILELEELKALVHASPVYHQQYLLNRKYVLCQSLDGALYGVAAEACVTYRSITVDLSNDKYRGAVDELMKSYRARRRSPPQYSIFHEALTLEEAKAIAAFHLSVIVPLIQRYTEWALDNLGKETQNPRLQEPLSTMETTRIMRALYRFELCCNVFGNGSLPDRKRPWNDFDIEDFYAIFISLFEPWEVEEMACIFAFSEAQYQAIFDKIPCDVYVNNPKFAWEYPHTPINEREKSQCTLPFSINKKAFTYESN